VVLTELHIPAWKDRASIATSMVATHPENAHAHYLLGYLALERNDLPAAEEHLARSLSLRRTARALDAQCVLDLRRNQLGLADQACAEAASIDPTNPRVWLNHASVNVRAKQWQRALEDAEHAIALKPRYPEAHYLAAISAANLGLMPLAASHVEAGLDAEPTNARLLGLKAKLDPREPPPPPPPPPP
jgi:tetratricopeptide (TPR) repeat protein